MTVGSWGLFALCAFVTAFVIIWMPVQQNDSQFAAAASSATDSSPNYFCVYLQVLSGASAPAKYCTYVRPPTASNSWEGFLQSLGVVPAETHSSVAANVVIGQHAAQVVSVDGYDIYSPEPVAFNNTLRLYFGGWYTSADAPHDGISVADCPQSGVACGNVRKVIDATASGLYQINDPSIVLHPAIGNSAAYYIMYVTGAQDSSLASNAIYYSTSFANDGLTWSKPQLLINGYWLPSATWKDDHVELYANSTSDGVVRMFDLGNSGIDQVSPQPLVFDNPTSVPPFYSNVNVQWRSSINLYQMLAERLLSSNENSSSVIDYLSSTDGVHWHLGHPSVITPAAGEYRVGTPAQDPDTAFNTFFGSTASQNSLDFKIRFTHWSVPN